MSRTSRVVGRPSAKQQLLKRLDQAWKAFKESYTGLPPFWLTKPGVTEDWSVKDILGHVTTWEAEALKHLPVIIAGGRPPRYVTFGGIDAFNAKMTATKRSLSLTAVLRQLDDTHRRLLRFIGHMPARHFTPNSRARRRVRLDTYAHYPQHAEAIRRWRGRIGY